MQFWPQERHLSMSPGTGLRAGVLQRLMSLPASPNNHLRMRTPFGASHLCWRDPGLAQEVAHDACEHGVGLGLGLLEAGLAAAAQRVGDPRRHAGAVPQAGARDQLLLEHHALLREDLRSAEGASSDSRCEGRHLLQAALAAVPWHICLLWQRAEATSRVLRVISFSS